VGFPWKAPLALWEFQAGPGLLLNPLETLFLDAPMLDYKRFENKQDITGKTLCKSIG
jgi:hypothetical protein